MTAKNREFEEACARLFAAFFERFRDDELRDLANQALALLLKRQTEFPGDPGDWAGGIVSAFARKGCGVPGIPNADLERAFGTTMATIRERAEQVKHALGLDAPPQPAASTVKEFTLRDEANAICAYAFRNGPLERIHEEYRISQSDMKEFTVNASEHLAKLMAMKQQSPEEYTRFIRHYHSQFCLSWER